ncbi:MAG TPA: PEGA domain-containing protein [Polyangia bacterium]|nr:PEGA domain-containing protein [Polyangia bacterium]
MPVRIFALTVALLSCSTLAVAREQTAAIAPMPTAQTVPPELQAAFADELPRSLSLGGFKLMPPNEVDMKVGERPELLQCRSGGCLAEEAAFLKVDRLILPRLEPAPDGGFTIGVSVFDAGQKKILCEGVDRVSAPAELHDRLTVIVGRLRGELLRPGRLEVHAQPTAVVSVDGLAKGATPWTGELDPGDHVVALEAGGARVERDVNVAPGSTARVDVTLAVAPTPTHSRALRPLKWVTLVGGVLAVGAGAALVALDGHGTCTRVSGQVECPDVYDTRTGGYVAIGAGGALVVTSVILFVLDRPRR